MGTRAVLGAVALAIALTLSGCSREETPPPPEAAVKTPEEINAAVRAELEKAAKALQSDDLAKQAAPAAAAPNAMSEKDMEEARKAIEGMLENVRKELEQKSASLGQPAPGAAPGPAADASSPPAPQQ